MQQQQHNDKPDMKGAFNLGYLLANGHALTCAVFLRRHFGKEAIGFSGIAGFFIILIYGGLMNSYPMFIFLCAYLLAVIGQRMQQFQLYRKGVIIHSRYNGYPWLALKLFPRVKDEGNAKGVEAFMCLAIGGLLSYIDQPLGWFIMAGFFSIMVSEGVNAELLKRRLQAMKDAEIEQQDLAEHYRNFR